jgi:DNA-binding IclR family transcriptional regulator
MNLSQDVDSRAASVAADDGGDQPLDRALAVLQAVADAPRPASITELALDCGLPVPTVHRLVGRLEKRNMIGRPPGSKRVVVGPALVRLGLASLEAAIRGDRPHQVLVALANRIGEHCQLGRRFDDAIVYMDSARAARSEGLYFESGRRAPMYCTSIGKLFLAEMSDADLDWWLAHAALERMTPTTIVAPGSLRAVVRRVRREGWAATDGELIAGVVGCAVPIRDAAGRLVAGLGISAPSARVTSAQVQNFRPLMDAAATEIALSLAGDD